MLKSNIIVIIHIINPNNTMTFLQKEFSGFGSDKSGDAGDEVCWHCVSGSHSRPASGARDAEARCFFHHPPAVAGLRTQRFEREINSIELEGFFTLYEN
jgi:hypothetical protein